MKEKKIPEKTQSEESETKSFNFLRLLRGSMKSCRIWPDETFNFILFWIITIFIIIPNASYYWRMQVKAKLMANLSNCRSCLSSCMKSGMWNILLQSRKHFHSLALVLNTYISTQRRRNWRNLSTTLKIVTQNVSTLKSKDWSNASIYTSLFFIQHSNMDQQIGKNRLSWCSEIYIV